jgi:hypothetical protein
MIEKPYRKVGKDRCISLPREWLEANGRPSMVQLEEIVDLSGKEATGLTVRAVKWSDVAETRLPGEKAKGMTTGNPGGI